MLIGAQRSRKKLYRPFKGNFKDLKAKITVIQLIISILSGNETQRIIEREERREKTAENNKSATPAGKRPVSPQSTTPRKTCKAGLKTG